jgi:hypothetical protein
MANNGSLGGELISDAHLQRACILFLLPLERNCLVTEAIAYDYKV